MLSEPPKVLISCNRADRAWLEWITGVTEQAGYEPILEVWHFRPGENFVLRMREAAKQADFTLAVLSDAYLQVTYTRPEWAAAFAQDPTGKGRRLIPVRVAKCVLTGMLAPIIHINLSRSRRAGRGARTGQWAKSLWKASAAPSFPSPPAKPGISLAPFPPNIGKAEKAFEPWNKSL
jgi:hypothetical protein